MHPEFAPIAFISALSLLVPFPWHLRAGNVATLSIIAWLFVFNLIYAIDAIIWAGNVDKVASVWCDISTKIIVGANLALPAACLCVCIHLEQVASVRVARATLSDKRRRQIFEAVMCFGLPVIFMVLHYIVQGHRFDIIEDYGCRPSQYFSIASIFILYIPPLITSLVAVIFAGLALRHFIRRRASFATHLSSNSALTTSRYLRLMLMSALQMVSSITVTSYSLAFTALTIRIRPWTSWEDVHFNFSRIDVYPTIFISDAVLRSYNAAWWMIPMSTWLFVAFFAFGHDAMEEYKKGFAWIRVHIFRQRSSTTKRPFLSLPIVRTDSSFPARSVTRPDTSKETISHSLTTLSSFTESVSSLPRKSSARVEGYDTGSTTDLSYYGLLSSKSSPTETSTPTTTTELLPLPQARPPRVLQNPFIVRPLTYPSPDVRTIRGINLPNPGNF